MATGGRDAQSIALTNGRDPGATRQAATAEGPCAILRVLATLTMICFLLKTRASTGTPCMCIGTILLKDLTACLLHTMLPCVVLQLSNRQSKAHYIHKTHATDGTPTALQHKKVSYIP